MVIGGVSTKSSVTPILRSTTRRPYGYVDVFYAGVKKVRLSILNATFSEDESRSTRWESTVDLVDKTGDLIPRDMNDLLAPKGTQFKMYMGFDDEEATACGVYEITNPKAASTAAAAKLSLKGNDLSVAISDAVWEETHTPGNVTIDQAIKEGVADRVPSIQTLLVATNTLVPPGRVWGVEASNDPWKDFEDLADGTPYELRFDQNGVLLLQPGVVDFNNPVASYIMGDNKLLKCDREMNPGHPTYNGIIVTGESPSGGSIRVIVYDTDQGSPTYYLGPYGKKLLPFNSSTITDSNQAEVVGKQLLLDNLGLRHTITLNVIRDPKVKAGDVIKVGHPPTKTDGYFIVRSRSMNLLSGAMQLVCRERVVQ